MKTFNDIINESTAKPYDGFPTFTDAVQEGNLVGRAFNKMYKLQLELQKTTTEMLDYRDKYFAAKGNDAEQSKIKEKLIELSAKKKALEKTIADVEIETEKALSIEDGASDIHNLF